MTSSFLHDNNETPSPSTASPEELDELDRFDCGLLSLEERGRFLAKLYADGEKRRSVSEMFDLELLRRPEMDDLQDAPATSDDVQTRSVDARPRWNENPRVLRALLTISASICVVCVLYILRPVSAPVDVVGRRENAQVAKNSAAATNFDSRERLGSKRNDDALFAEADVDEEESAPAEGESQSFDDDSVVPELALEDSADEVAAFSVAAENGFAARPKEAFDFDKKVVPPRANGFGGFEAASAPSPSGAMGAPTNSDDDVVMSAPDFVAKTTSEPNAENRAMGGGNAMGGGRGMGGMGGGMGAMGGGFAGTSGAAAGGMGMAGGAPRNLNGGKGAARGLTLSASPVASTDGSESLASRAFKERETSDEAKTSTLDLFEIVERETLRKARMASADSTAPDVRNEIQESTAEDSSSAVDAPSDDAWTTTIDELLRSGKFREARAAWDRLPPSLKDGAQGKTRQGILLYFEGDLDAAERAFLDAFRYAPDDPIAAQNLAFIHKFAKKTGGSDEGSDEESDAPDP